MKIIDNTSVITAAMIPNTLLAFLMSPPTECL